jgi:hypothetical protein
VYGVDSTRVPAVVAPLGDVVVTIFRPVTRPGRDSSDVRYDSVGVERTGALGRFAFPGLLPGTYVLRAVPPAGSGYPAARVTVTAYSVRSLALTVPVRIYLHKLR